MFDDLPQDEKALTIPGQTTVGWVKPLDKSAFDGIVVERVHSMQPDTVIEGILLGRGRTLESTDERTGEVHPIHTHRIKVNEGLAVDVMELWALRPLRDYAVGQRVRLIHGGMIRRGAKQIADVIVAPVGAAPEGAKPDSSWQ